jgi:arylformamidase
LRFASGASFFSDYVAVAPQGAEALVARGVQLVGVDALSVESDTTGAFPVHHRLLGAGTWIIEGLRLAEARPGIRELGCLPLRLTGIDGAPCRAVLWE